jgi:hypothetical protein
MTDTQHVPAGKRVGDRALRADLRSRVGLVDPPDQVLQLIQYRDCLCQQRDRLDRHPIGREQ